MAARLPLAFVLVTLLSGWLIAAASYGDAPAGDYMPDPRQTWLIAGENAAARRLDMLRRAEVRLQSGPRPAALTTSRIAAGDPLNSTMPVCRFLLTDPSGTSPKFDCVLAGGEVVKVKYGRNPELHAEVAATRLLAALGYPADEVEFVPRLRCYGCPRHPFLAMHALSLVPGDWLSPHGYTAGFTDFTWVAVERRFGAPAIETEDAEGWAFWELKHSRAPRADLDALRLLAVFLGHWDNKAENQRLVCLDQGPPPAHGECQRPLAMIQDAGAMFGPSKVNLTRWRELPIWKNRDECLISLRDTPHRGATFPDAQVSEAGRRQLATALLLLPDADIRRLFRDARFPEYQTGTPDEGDLEAWTQAFIDKVQQVATGPPCPV